MAKISIPGKFFSTERKRGILMSPTGPSAIEESDQINSSALEQRETLLSTKMFAPSIRPDHVSRHRLPLELSIFAILLLTLGVLLLGREVYHLK
jgi:hypothetical protein